MLTLSCLLRSIQCTRQIRLVKKPCDRVWFELKLSQNTRACSIAANIDPKSFEPYTWSLRVRQRERIFARDYMRSRQYFGKLILPELPVEGKLSEVGSDQLRVAIKDGDLDTMSRLLRHCSPQSANKSSHELPVAELSILGAKVKQHALDCLSQPHISENLHKLLMFLQPLHPMLSKMTNSEIIRELLRYTEKHSNSLALEDWCHVASFLNDWNSNILQMNDVKKYRPAYWTFRNRFIYRTMSNVKNLEDFVNVCYLATGLSEFLQSDSTKVGQKIALTLGFLMKNPYNVQRLSSDMETYAIISRTLFIHQTKCSSRTALSLGLETISRMMAKAEEAGEISTPLGMCIKSVSNSLAQKELFAKYDYMRSKMFSSLEAALPISNKLGFSWSVRLVHGMIGNRHVHMDLVHQLVMNALENESWRTVTRCKEHTTMLWMLGTIGYTQNREIYSLLIEELTKPERIEEVTKHPQTFISCLQGLAYVNIFPSQLYEKLFRMEDLMLMKHTFQKAERTNGSRSRVLLGLEGALRNLAPEYNGPLFSTEFRERLRREALPDLRTMGSKEESVETHYSLMLKEIATIATRDLPEYTVEVKPPMEHLIIPDVVLTSKLDNSKVVVMPLDESFYFKLYIKKDGRYKVTLRLAGQHRCKKRELEALQYRCIRIPFHEYNQLDDRKGYIHSKLKTGLVAEPTPDDDM